MLRCIKCPFLHDEPALVRPDSSSGIETVHVAVQNSFGNLPSDDVLHAGAFESQFATALVAHDRPVVGTGVEVKSP